MAATEALVLRGWSQGGDAASVSTTVTLGSESFSVRAGDSRLWWAAYRDVTRVDVEAGALRLVLGAGDASPWTFERFGPMLGALARGLRDGRFRQWLADGFVEVPSDEPVDLVEVEMDGLDGVAQVLYHDRGVAIAPLDAWARRVRIRRADIGAVTGVQGTGRIRVEADGTAFELVGLGAHEVSHRQRLLALRDAAASDMAAILGRRLVDAPFDLRQLVLGVLREGRPAGPAELGDAFPVVERSVLTDPGFAASYRALIDRAGGPSAPRWLALAPTRPRETDDPMAWFLVGLPGNLLALELVSAGAHATYLYRVAPRATFDAGRPDPVQLGTAVHDVSEALLDARFLREPMAVPDERLGEQRFLRYRLALAVLPSLAAARARFVARLVHSDAVSWAAALDDLIAWHGTTRDETAVWPGRASQENAIEQAGSAETTPQS